MKANRPEIPSVLYHGEAKVERKVRYLSRLRLYYRYLVFLFLIFRVSNTQVYGGIGIKCLKVIGNWYVMVFRELQLTHQSSAKRLRG
jgi:hypothetical protein